MFSSAESAHKFKTTFFLYILPNKEERSSGRFRCFYRRCCCRALSSESENIGLLLVVFFFVRLLLLRAQSVSVVCEIEKFL